jgi:UDP-N-acetylmuramoyl-tripeptide--D-alanyl-D-alanine ligase
MHVKFNLPEVIRWIETESNQKAEYTPFQTIVFSEVAVDSRLVKPGMLFFALPGAKTDGHQFLQQVASIGVCAAIVSKDYRGEHFGIPLIRFDNVLSALQGFAKHLLKKRKPHIVAITGSVGKTTTKDFTTTLLQKKFRIGSTPGNSNSQIGLPLTVINHTKPEDELLILEMGMTEPGQITKLVNLATPDIAVLTAVEMVHSCNFKSIEGIAHAKAEIFSHPKTKIGIVSRDIAAFSEVLATGTCLKTSFSINHEDADFYLKEEGDHLLVRDFEKAKLPALQVLGRHNLHNFLAAAAVARNLNLTWEEIAAEIPRLCLPERRLQRVEKEGVIYINDSYNATAVSVKAALSVLPKPKAGCKTIAVIGDMKESLGAFSEWCHREVGNAALSCVDQMLCLGSGCVPIVEIWQKANKSIELYPDFNALSTALRHTVKPGDVVLIKGSNSHQLWRILEEGK